MKKLFAIAFTCVYLTLAVGVAKTTHYCMGRVNQQSYFTFDPQSCGCALFAKKDAKSCCDDENEWIHIADDQHATTTIDVTAPVLADLGPVYSLEAPIQLTETPIQAHFREHIPPTGPPLFQLNCSYVFYDSQA